MLTKQRIMHSIHITGKKHQDLLLPPMSMHAIEPW